MTARACRLRAASAGPLARAASTLQNRAGIRYGRKRSRVGREHVVRRGGTLERVPPRAHHFGLGAYMARVWESCGLLCGVDMIGALPSVLR